VKEKFAELNEQQITTPFYKSSQIKEFTALAWKWKTQEEEDEGARIENT
jgi:hypothetical protein